MQTPWSIIVRDIFRDTLLAISCGAVTAIILKAAVALFSIGAISTGVGAIILGTGALVGIAAWCYYSRCSYLRRHFVFGKLARQTTALMASVTRLNQDIQSLTNQQEVLLANIARQTCSSPSEIRQHSLNRLPKATLLEQSDLLPRRCQVSRWENFKRFIGVSHEVFSDIVAAENVTELDVRGHISPHGMSLIVLIAGVITCCLYPILKKAKHLCNPP